MTVRDARREASERLGPAYVPAVLEPSPPAVLDGDFADDPTAVVADGAATLVLPFTDAPDGATTWVTLASADDDLASFAAGRWLGPWSRLSPLPDTMVATRRALHQLAVYAISPARRAANGKIGLRYTTDGFGTPFFARDGSDVQVRVERGALAVQQDGPAPTARSAEITTVAAAAALIGVDIDRDAADRFDVPALDEGTLAVDPPAAGALGDWYGFTCSVLEELRWSWRQRAETGGIAPPSRVQLWPEHFDLAFDAGDPSAAVSTRANFGGSPGDSSSDEPYLYVGPFDRTGLDGDPYWNAPFGATLPFAALLDAPDQRAAALEFFRAGAARLAER